MTSNLDQFLQQERAKMRRDITQVHSSRLQVLQRAKKFGLYNRTEKQDGDDHYDDSNNDEKGLVPTSLQESVFGHSSKTESISVWQIEPSNEKGEEEKLSEDEILAAERKANEDRDLSSGSVMWSRIEPINTLIEDETIEALRPSTPTEFSNPLIHSPSTEPVIDDDLVGSKHGDDVSACQSEDVETMFSSYATRLDP